MRVDDLFRLLGPDVSVVGPEPMDRSAPIGGIADTAAEAVPGGLFAALPGTRVNGIDFVDQAVAAGARIILAPAGTPRPSGLEADHLFLTHANPRRALALLAAAFHAPQPEIVVAVTGTNGKTSTVSFCRQIWAHLGCEDAASIGTLGIGSRSVSGTDGMTTPGPIGLHRALERIRETGGGPVAMEASSHGLEQFRLDGVHLKAAALTNITRDHLDHHGTMDRYRAAKMRLFTDVLPADGTVIVNADSDAAPLVRQIAANRGLRLWDYGRTATQMRIVSSRPDADGQSLDLSIFERTATVHLPLAGDFQAMNALCALGLVVAASGNATHIDEAIVALERLNGVPGRLEQVARHPTGAGVYVDYAHTPDALETVLKALRPHARNRLICVFGCGGDRDAGKRPLMGRVAARLADVVIVTDDNPRSEDPAVIRRSVLAAAPGALEIGDRAEAIRAAVLVLKTGDVLLIAGKGHETTQTVGDKVLPFSDADEARASVREAEE